VAAICKKKGYESCKVGADGSVFNKYPHFKARGAQALREILDWGEKTPATATPPSGSGTESAATGKGGNAAEAAPGNGDGAKVSFPPSGVLGDPVEIIPAEDGSGVGAALIAALTIKRVKEGNVAGVRDVQGVKQVAKDHADGVVAPQV
jgi:hexokinase